MATAAQDTQTTIAVRAHRKHQLALAYRLLAALRWGDMGDGHISARDPEHTDCFWMLPLGISFHQGMVDDMVLVGPDGKVREGTRTDINMSGYYIHHPIHTARPDAVSAAHVHTPWGTPFSAEGRQIEPITQESCLFFEDTALFDDEEVQVQDTDCGERIAKALGSNAAVILKNHGLLTVGDSVAETVGRFVMLERVAEAHMKTTQAKAISRDGALYAKTDLIRIGSGAGVFESLIQRHVEDTNTVLSS
ncbi:MAG: class II aldolase/adducin family protein [Pseudomonadota bacterium]